MKIAVCIKQVPEGDARLKIDADGISIADADLATEINESDQYALESGLRLAESQGGEVVVVCLGPDRAEEAIAAAIERENVDLVLTGLQSDDAGWAQTGPILAARLGWPSATLIMEIEPEGDTIKVKRELEAGWFQWVRLPLPALLTIQSGISTVRYATLKGIMGAKKKEIAKVTPADIGLAPDEVGGAGRKTRMTRLYVPEKATGAEIIEGDTATAVATLVEKLQKEAKVL